MMKSAVFCLCLLFSSAPIRGLSSGDLQLELASVVFRHGDRSPIHIFPTDPYTEADWPQGFGQLSIVGMQQQYKLGELLKARYVNNDGCLGLVCANYTRVQVRIRSTDVDRTLMSAESQLSAFFPPDETQMFNDSLRWQPIPVHTKPVEDDYLLRAGDSCPAFKALTADDSNSPQYREMSEKYKDFLANISENTGMTVNLTNLWMIQDTLFIQSVSPGYEVPSWVSNDTLSTLQLLADFSMTLMFNSTAKNKLSAGMWIGKVLSDMKGKANPNGNKTLEDMQLYLYSAHDTTVAAMTSALHVFNDKQPGYATAFTVELYSDANRQFYVRMYRRNGPYSDTFDLLNATYCSLENGTLCTLQDFENFVTPLVPPDIEKACNPPSTSPTTSATTSSTASSTSSPTTSASNAPSSLSDLEKQVHDLRGAVIGLGSAFAFLLIITIILIVVLITVWRRSKQHSYIRSERLLPS